jgi:S-methylmethionine-dependent homocysteine/selenocysteine methylase
VTTDLGASRLPQLDGRPMVTDGGMETDLIFHHGVDLPYFAAFPLLESAEGRALLEDYYNGYAAVARRAGAGLLLESGATYRASLDWGARLGYDLADLERVNIAAIAMLSRLRERYASTITDVIIGGEVGPRGDAYRPGQPTEPDEAAAYHSPQIQALAEAGADLVTAYTISDTAEAIGIVQAARSARLPVAISFTVETDGQLPRGEPLAQAIATVDAAAAPDYYLVNCAHPAHVELGLTGPGRWCERLLGMRYNASARSHAELCESTELDAGDPDLLAAAHQRLTPLLPHMSIVGGCCGTDARHVATLWGVA